MTAPFKARPYAEIKAARQAAILAGEKLIAKGACFFCAWELPKPALYCCGDCASEYQKERAELVGPAGSP